MSDFTDEAQRLQSQELIEELLETALAKSRAGLLSPDLPEEPLDDQIAFQFTLKDDAELVTSYEKALGSLYRELVPNHTGWNELYVGLGELFRSTVSTAQAYPDTASLRDPIDRFADKYKPPLVRREVAFTVDFLDLGSHSIVIDNVTFLTPNEATLTEIGFPIDEWQDRASRVGAITLASTEVQGADTRLLFDSGRTRVLDALTKLKIAALEGLAARGSPDQSLLWRLGELWLPIRMVDDATPTMANYHRSFRPSVSGLGERVAIGMGRLKIDRLETLPVDIRERLEIASYWISHSVNHEENAHKIVDLCTALEVMRLPGEKEAPKADKIALRYYPSVST